MGQQKKKRNTIVHVVDDAAFMALRSVIKDVAPKSTPEDWVLAEVRLRSAISSARQEFPYLHRMQNIKTSGSGIGSSRNALGRAKKAFDEALKALEEIKSDLTAMRLFCLSVGPFGRVKHETKAYSNAAAKAYLAACKMPDHPPVRLQSYLASSVVTVMQDVLKVRVTMTTDRGVRGKSRGGAYCRLLRATLVCAGAAPPDDLRPIMGKGKAWAREMGEG